MIKNNEYMNLRKGNKYYLTSYITPKNNKYINIMESKEDKFKRLANARVNNAIKQLDLIGNLSNSASYDYSDDEVKKIISTLNQKVKEVSFKFQESLKKEKFKL